MKVDLIDKEFL